MLHYEYTVSVQHKYQELPDKWTNLRAITEGPGKRSYPDEQSARAALYKYIEQWNGPFKYDADGKRVAAVTEIGGGFTATVVSDKRMDDGMRITGWHITRRLVDDWEDFDEGYIP